MIHSDMQPSRSSITSRKGIGFHTLYVIDFTAFTALGIRWAIIQLTDKRKLRSFRYNNNPTCTWSRFSCDVTDPTTLLIGVKTFQENYMVVWKPDPAISYRNSDSSSKTTLRTPHKIMAVRHIRNIMWFHECQIQQYLNETRTLHLKQHSELYTQLFLTGSTPLLYGGTKFQKDHVSYESLHLLFILSTLVWVLTDIIGNITYIYRHS